jgi:hypothetical protein
MKAKRDRQPDRYCSLRSAALFLPLNLAGIILFTAGLLWFFDGHEFISGFPASAPGASASPIDGFLLTAGAAHRVHQAEGASRS